MRLRGNREEGGDKRIQTQVRLRGDGEEEGDKRTQTQVRVMRAVRLEVQGEGQERERKGRTARRLQFPLITSPPLFRFCPSSVKTRS